MSMHVIQLTHLIAVTLGDTHASSPLISQIPRYARVSWFTTTTSTRTPVLFVGSLALGNPNLKGTTSFRVEAGGGGCEITRELWKDLG